MRLVLFDSILFGTIFLVSFIVQFHLLFGIGPDVQTSLVSFASNAIWGVPFFLLRNSVIARIAAIPGGLALFRGRNRYVAAAVFDGGLMILFSKILMSLKLVWLAIFAPNGIAFDIVMNNLGDFGLDYLAIVAAAGVVLGLTRDKLKPVFVPR